MSFILLARSADGRIDLLSPTSHETRAEALAELSVITADPAFTCWDDEVLVMDLETATPVLLMRPATPATEPDASGALDTEPDTSVATDTPDTTDPPVDDPIAAVIEGLSDEDDTSLKDALLRTTVQLESEGITAPESIGPETEAAGFDIDDVADTAERPSAPAPADGAWPWDVEKPPGVFDLDALEEPRDDDSGSLIRAAGDDDTMSVTRPVILGTEFVSEAPTIDLEEPSVASPVPELPSDFVELGAIVPQQEQAAPPRAAPDSVATMTCDDCVYTETCPHRGEQDPASCGSFQWK